VHVRYGRQALTGGENKQFKEAIGFAFALDVLSGFVGMVLAILLLPLIGNWFGLDDRYLTAAMLYCTLLPTMAAATPIGVLRSLDRFDLISWQGTTYPIARALLAGIGWWAEAPFEAFLAIWYVSELGGDAYIWFLTWRELRRHDLLHGIRPTLRPQHLPGAWRFAVQVNLTSSLNTAWGPVAQLIVGGQVGPAGAAIYRVASSLADSAQKPADLLGKVFYPEVVRLDLATGHPWRLMLRGAFLSGSIGIAFAAVVVIGGRPLLAALFGPEFTGAYHALLVMIGALLLTMIAFPLTPMLYALDRTLAPLVARVLGASVYVAAIFPLAYRFGIVGAALAFVLGNLVMFGWLGLSLAREYRRLRRTRA
jgi:O-antigen/teichoic acid export membrane protein